MQNSTRQTKSPFLTSKLFTEEQKREGTFQILNYSLNNFDRVTPPIKRLDARQNIPRQILNKKISQDNRTIQLYTKGDEKIFKDHKKSLTMISINIDHDLKKS